MSRVVTNRIFSLYPFMRAQHILSYHLIKVPRREWKKGTHSLKPFNIRADFLSCDILGESKVHIFLNASIENKYVMTCDLFSNNPHNSFPFNLDDMY